MKFAIGTLVQWYEIEMMEEHLHALKAMVDKSKERDPDNQIYIEFIFSTQEYLDSIDRTKVTIPELQDRFRNLVQKYLGFGATVSFKDNSDAFFNIMQYRRTFSDRMTDSGFDVIMWGESDALWPSTGLIIISEVFQLAQNENIHRWVLSFTDRKMWDDSWNILEHPSVSKIKRWNPDSPEWMENEMSSKGYMSWERMEEINALAGDADIGMINYPKFDGACLVFTSEMVKAGINIPRAVLMCGEDTAFGSMAKRILGAKYTQFIVKNKLRVHNRRHPRKRLYVKDEDNPRGLNGEGGKGDWFREGVNISNRNAAMVYESQDKFTTTEEFLKQIGKCLE